MWRPFAASCCCGVQLDNLKSLLKVLREKKGSAASIISSNAVMMQKHKQRSEKDSQQLEISSLDLEAGVLGVVDEQKRKKGKVKESVLWGIHCSNIPIQG